MLWIKPRPASIHGFEAHVVDPDLAGLGIEDQEVEGQGGGVGLGHEDAFDPA